MGEYQRLNTKSHKHADDLRVARVSPKDANTFTQSIYLPSMTYSSQITSFTKKQLHKIQSPYTRTVLNKQHYPRNFPTPMVYGPKEMGGLGHAHLFAKQGTAKTIAFLRNYRNQHGLLPDSMKIAHEWVHLYAGCTKSPLQDTTTPMPHLIDGWFKNLREYLQYTYTNLWFPEGEVRNVQKRRQNDRVLGDDICNAGLTPTHTNHLNWVKLYLKVETLSDISTIRGTHLDTNALHRNTAQAPTVTQRQWPVQALPGERQFEKWRSFLRKRYCHSARSNQLKQPLGRWTEHNQESLWESYFDPEFHSVSIAKEGYWHVYPVHKTKYPIFGGRIHPTSWALDNKPPRYGIPTEIHRNGQWCDIPDEYTSPITLTTSPPTIKDFPSYIQALPAWEKQMLENFKEVDHQGPPLIQLLQTQGGLSKLTIGSDGGAIPHGPFKGYGSLGWCICTKHTLLWRGQGPVRGYPDNPSFRTEAYAMLTFLRLIIHQYHFWEVPIPDALVNGHTDSLSLINKMTSMNHMKNDWYSPVFTWHHIDVLQQIDDSLKQLKPLNFMPLHVKAHADKKKALKELTRQEQVNVYCD
jgi:hypothetical protein